MRQERHARSSSQGHKVLPSHARPGKATPLKRGSSYNHAHSHGNAISSGKASAVASRKASHELVVQPSEDSDDMASFLQFCTTCERQIVSPNPSILYCSEACRRRDSSQAVIIPPTQSPLMTPSSPSYADSRPPDIITPRSPTVLRPVSLTFSDVTISDHGSPPEHSADYLDYMEAGTFPKSHIGSWSAESQSNAQPRFNRTSTGAVSSNLPSLSHTPESSMGTIGSVILQRPMPSRHNESYSATSTKSEDLVNPFPKVASSSALHPPESRLKSCASTETAFKVAQADGLSYERRPSTRRRFSEAQGSLKQLFSHDAMRGVPS